VINLNKVVIVGGGSAGWMSAATFIKAFPDREIVVVESPDYPTVGVGESTLASIKVWTNWLGINEKDFMKSCDAVYKMSIKFNDFYQKADGGFHYPFGSSFTQHTATGLNDWHVRKILNPEIPVQDYARTFFPGVHLAELGRINNNANGEFDNFNFERDVPYHIDATKFGLWLKEKYCIPRGVKLVPQTVLDFKTNEDGIEYLLLDNNEQIAADLFIDCTGFKSLLIEGAMNEPFEDFSSVLPNNRAWATRIKYLNEEEEMVPYTNCTAIDNGWVWNVPSWERIGTGYVYSDKFVSPEDALKEFKEHLKANRSHIHGYDDYVESLPFKDVKFRVGIHRKSWVKNVVAIGLASGFIEPLEGNGLFSVHEFLLKLIKSLSRGTANQWDRDAYNVTVYNQFISFQQFVAMHYALSNRDDTKYWKNITNTVFQPRLYEDKVNHPAVRGFQDLAERKMNEQEYLVSTGVHCIATGMQYFPIDKHSLDRLCFSMGKDYYQICRQSFGNMDMLKKKWRGEAEKSPTMYQYLKNTIYLD
jgi:hypothetical protein